MEYLLHLLIIVGIYSILAMSLDLLVGYTGLLSLMHAGIFGIGAYTAAILGLQSVVPFSAGICASVTICVLAGLAVAIPSLRIRDDHFAIATFSLQVVVFSLFNNWDSLTGGPPGLPGIPQPVLLGWHVSSHGAFLVLILAGVAATACIRTMCMHSPFGRVLRAIREDEVLASAHGRNVATTRVVVFGITAGLAGMAGALYASYISYIDPTSFTVMESIFIISIVIIGGAGSLWGPVLGAILLVTMPEFLRFIGIPSAIAANMRQILYGAALVACMLWRPHGLIGEYAFGHEAKTK